MMMMLRIENEIQRSILNANSQPAKKSKENQDDIDMILSFHENWKVDPENVRFLFSILFLSKLSYSRCHKQG